MGSTQSLIECPMCQSQECLEDFEYNIGSVFIFCSRCGYYKNVCMKRDQNGEIIIKNGEPVWEVVEVKGRGIVKIKSGIGYSVYTIPHNDKKRVKFLTSIQEFKKKNLAVEVIISYYNEKLTDEKNFITT